MTIKNIKYTTLMLFALLFIYLGSIPNDDKCDLVLKTIDYTVSGAYGTKEMLYGHMSNFSYTRQKIANKLKQFYDNSDCY
jgi:hypothetical protein